MTAPVGERLDALSSAVDSAAASVAELAEHLRGLEAEHHRLLVAGDTAAAGPVLDQIATLRGRLAASEAARDALVAARAEVAAQQQRDAWRAELDQARAELVAANDESGRMLAEIGPLLSAAKAALIAAEKAEQAGRIAAARIQDLRVTLGEQNGHMRTAPGRPNAVEYAYATRPLWRDIRHSADT